MKRHAFWVGLAGFVSWGFLAMLINEARKAGGQYTFECRTPVMHCGFEAVLFVVLAAFSAFLAARAARGR